MKAKKLFALICVGAMLMSLAGCGDQNSTSSMTSANGTATSTENTSPLSEATSNAESENSTSVEDVYSNKAYLVGEDLPADSYIINCTISEYGMDIIVFESEKDFQDFENTDKITNGEYRAAIEKYAWVDFYLYEENSSYISLQNGNIILLNNGKCEFTKHDNLSSTLYSGLYIAGEDITCGKLDIKCTSDYLQVTVFENKDKYLDYHTSSRFTNGEEDDAIEKYSISTDFIYTDNITSIDLSDGMILMVENGIGEYSIDDGPIIN